MNFKQLTSDQIQLITKGIRDAFKRDDKYNTCIKSSRVVKDRFNKDGKLSKKPDVYHRCNNCKELFKQVDIQVDHIIPVVPLNKNQSDMNIQEYLNNTFEYPVQVLCKPCHKIKSKEENKIRRNNTKK